MRENEKTKTLRSIMASGIMVCGGFQKVERLVSVFSEENCKVIKSLLTFVRLDVFDC